MILVVIGFGVATMKVHTVFSEEILPLEGTNQQIISTLSDSEIAEMNDFEIISESIIDLTDDDRTQLRDNDYLCCIENVEFIIRMENNALTYAFFPGTAAQDKALVIQRFKEGIVNKTKALWEENAVSSKLEANERSRERVKLAFWKYIKLISIK